MIDQLFNNQTMALLQKSLDASALQHKMIINNLANVETPGFKRSEVVFTQKLQSAIAAQNAAAGELPATLTHEKHIAFNHADTLDEVKPSIVTRNDTTLRNDGNNVDIDAEMSSLAENQVFYEALTKVTSMRLSMLKTSIREGK